MPKRLSCHFCCSDFPDARARRVHERRHHTVRRKQFCQQRKERVRAAPIFFYYNRRGASGKESKRLTIRCHICRKDITSYPPYAISNFDRHLTTHQERRTYSCRYCVKEFNTRRWREVHVAHDHPDLWAPDNLLPLVLTTEELAEERVTLNVIRERIHAYQKELAARQSAARRERKELLRRLLGLTEDGPVTTSRSRSLTPQWVDTTGRDGTVYRKTWCHYCRKEFYGKVNTVMSNLRRHVAAHRRKVDARCCAYCGEEFASKWECTMHERVEHDEDEEEPSNLLKAAFGEVFYQDSNELENVTLGEIKQKIQQWEQRWSERSSTMPRDTSASQPTSPHPQGSTDNEGDRSDSEEESESGSDDSSCSYDFTHRHGRFYTDDPREEVFSKLAKQISTQPDMDDTDGRSDQEKSDHKEYRLEDIPVLHLPCTTAYQCRFCGQYFSFKGTKALHEQKCVRRQLSNVKRRRRRLDNDSATDDNDSPAQLKTVYTCEDCGIEVSAQTKLNRHKKFYCPFRESAFSDPFLDAVGQTSKRSPIPETEIDSNAKVKDFEVLTGLKRQREDSTSDNDEEYEYIYVPTDSEDDGDEDSNDEHHRVKEIYNHDEDELLTKLRLDFKRRRSNNNKLTRRLLRKRLQAHEGLEAPPPPVALPHKKEKNDLLRMVTTGVESSVPKKGVTCPYDGCGKVFSKPSLYHRHVRRVHEK